MHIQNGDTHISSFDFLTKLDNFLSFHPMLIKFMPKCIVCQYASFQPYFSSTLLCPLNAEGFLLFYLDRGLHLLLFDMGMSIASC